MASAVSNTPASSFDISNFSNSLQCPIMFTPLTDAVILMPCGHTISEIAANRMFRGMLKVNDDEMVETRASCPICSDRVKACFPNQIVRSLAQSILGFNLAEALPVISATIAADEEKDIGSIPFPGIGAKFVLANGDWGIFNSRVGLIRQLKFKSQNEDSLFKMMNISGYRDGSVTISIQINKNYIKIGCDYLSSCGIDLESYVKDIGFCKSDRSSIKILFKILAKHNEIPADKFSLIRDLAMSGDWRRVTPLLPGESLSREISFDRFSPDRDCWS